MDNKSDPDDGDFLADGSLTGSSEEGGDTEIDEAQPSNIEVYLFFLFFNPHLPCINCRYPPFKNHSNHRTWVRKAKEE